MQANHGRRRPPGALAALTALAMIGTGAMLVAGAPGAVAGPRPAGRAASALVPRAATPVTPAGPVAGSGCTGTGGSTACHLYAVAGSVTLPGQVADVPAWKFRATADVPAAGALTGAGPVLVVNSGDTVTVTLDNVNVPDPVSLAVPGLAGLADTAPGAGTGAGVATGGAAKTYTFTAARPGTYLYEAGRTTNGPRQVLMGLTGALIVRPAGWSPSAATDLGAAALPASGFDDEAVLVLGDLDPAFAAAPLTYDLRAFRATYRTINGKVYPGTEQIPTAVNHRMLLRYLNAGAGNHSIGVQGLRQSVVAADSYPGSGQGLVADQLAPGQTEDALVTVAAEGNYPVADASGSLDTAGLTDGTTQLAFGGMMTLLGTDVTPPAADAVGPKSSITAMTPNPAKVTTPVTVAATFADPTTGGAHDVQLAEVLIDGEAGSLSPGSGLPFTPTNTGGGQATGTVTLSSAVLSTLSQGKHRIYVRAQDSIGNWGPLTSAVLNLATTGAATGNLSAGPSPTNGSADVGISATGDDSALGGTVDQARFAVDCEPAAAGCAPLAMTVASPGAATTAETGTLPAAAVQALGEGTHAVFVQTHDSEGFWGPSARVALVVDATAPSASALTVSPAGTDGTVGDPVDPTSLKVSGTFTDVATGKPTSVVAAAEGYFPPLVGGVQVAPTAATNGKGFTVVAKDGAFNSGTEAAYGLVPLSQLTAYPDGTYQIWVHARDAAGNWGPWGPAEFTLKRGLFADGFDAGTLAAWTGGTVPAPPGARLTVTAGAANSGGFGLAVSGAAQASATATVATPPIAPAATGYHLRFSFNPNGLGTYTQGGSATRPTYAAGLTGILTGMSGTAEAFQVQYQRVTPTAAAQVRLLFPLRGTSTPWTTIGSASWSSIQVDWATGTRATLSITVNGATSSLIRQDTSTRTIGATRLGLRDATRNVVGTAYFDTFVSSLNPLP